MNHETFLNDIPLSVAINAHSGTSFSPEKRGERARNDYAAQMAADYAGFMEWVSKHPEFQETLDREFARYREGYKQRYLKYLYSSSRIVSTMIAGPANFPVRQMNKRNDVAHKRLNEFIEFRQRALKAIQRELHPECRPIMSGDSDAVQRLTKELEEETNFHAHMKAINEAHKLYLADPNSLEGSPFSDKDKDLIRNYKPVFRWTPHPYAPSKLTNHAATIRRIEKRIEHLKAVKQQENKVVETGSGIRVEDCPSENRVRLFFPGKPEESVRTELKSNGFRWTPSLGCWQAYRNDRGMETARRFIRAEMKEAA